MGQYASNRDMNDVIKTMVQAGWSPEMGGKHGKLWSPDRKVFVSHSLSPSDTYAHKAFMRDIRRTCMKFGYTDPFAPALKIGPRWAKDHVSKVFQEKVQEALAETKQPKEETVTHKHKRLDKQAYSTIVQAKGQGKKWNEVAAIIEAQGYRTGTSGRVYNGNDIQMFMLRTDRAAKATSKISRVPVAVTIKNSSNVIHDVTEIISSNLADALKEKFLLAVLREYAR